LPQASPSLSKIPFFSHTTVKTLLATFLGGQIYSILDKYGRYFTNKYNSFFAIFHFQIHIDAGTYCSRKNNTVFLLFSLAFKLILHLCLRQKQKHGAVNAPSEMK
jgi:hypothetical protein